MTDIYQFGSNLQLHISLTAITNSLKHEVCTISTRDACAGQGGKLCLQDDKEVILMPFQARYDFFASSYHTSEQVVIKFYE